MKNQYMNKLTFVRGLLSFGLIALVFAIHAPLAAAQTVPHQSDFNHMRTGLPLTGAHLRTDCETCHAGGIFKGTPKNCSGCHSVGRRVVAPVKPANHMDTTAECDVCHTNTVTFTGARFNHMGVQPKACMTCHTGIHAPGKPSGHVATMSSCDSCHRTSSWIPAGFNHTGTFLVCANCHNGTNAIGKPGFHIPTSDPCDTCHKSGFTTFAGAIYSHPSPTVQPGNCGTCHISGLYRAKTKPAGHIPYTGNDCDSCHVGTGYITFAGSTMNHSVVSGTLCSVCHSGGYTSQGAFLGGAQAKHSGHVATSAECNTCHQGFVSFLGGAFNHATATPPVAGICGTCHNGSKALGKPATHITTSLSCDNAACHGNTTPPANNYTSFAGLTFNHVGVVAGTCGTCHLGQSASVKTKSQTHIPTTGNACDACHLNTTSFLAPTMNHTAVSSISCSICHNGAYLSEGSTGALSKSNTTPANNHIATSLDCNNCHHSFTTFAGVVYDHSGVAPTTCGSCHLTGIGGAKPKTAGHIPTTSNACDACHKTGYASFVNPTMNHAAVTSIRCDTCHNGSYLTEGTQFGGAKAKPAGNGHIPTTITGSLDCNTCHISTTSWLSEKMNHNGAQGKTGDLRACTTCHVSGAPYPGNMDKKSLTHDAGGHIDCSDSGCHRPLGSKGTSWVKWN